MSAPFVANGGIEKLPLSSVWGARLFPTRCHQVRRARSGCLLPATGTTRRQARGLGRGGAAGGFLFHARSVVTRALGVYHSNTGGLP